MLVARNLSEHVAVDDHHGHAALGQGRLRGQRHDPPGLVGVGDVFAEDAGLLVDLPLVDLLREVQPRLGPGHVGCDQENRGAVAVRLEDAVDEMQASGAAGAGADRKLSGHIGLAPRGHRADLLVADVHPAQVRGADLVRQVVDGVAHDAPAAFRTGLDQGFDHDLRDGLGHGASPIGSLRRGPRPDRWRAGSCRARRPSTNGHRWCRRGRRSAHSWPGRCGHGPSAALSRARRGA